MHGGGQRKANLLKTSGRTHFWGLWMVVLAKEISTSQKRAVALVFRGLWVVIIVREMSNSRNEQSHSFSGVVDGSSCQRDINLPKMSHCTHFQGVVGCGVAREW